MSKIKDIIQSSINVKQQVLQSEELIHDDREGSQCNCQQLLKMASMYIFVETGAVQPMPSIWLQNFPVDFILTGRPCLQKLFIATLLI